MFLLHRLCCGQQLSVRPQLFLCRLSHCCLPIFLLSRVCAPGDATTNDTHSLRQRIRRSRECDHSISWRPQQLHDERAGLTSTLQPRACSRGCTTRMSSLSCSKKSQNVAGGHQWRKGRICNGFPSVQYLWITGSVTNDLPSRSEAIRRLASVEGPVSGNSPGLSAGVFFLSIATRTGR
jgi:hypothetical protein